MPADQIKTKKELVAELGAARRKIAELEFFKAEAMETQTRTLRERVKELQCIYGLSDVAEDSSKPLGDILQEAVNLIPHGWQYPEITCARVIVEDKTYLTEKFWETEWILSQDIVVRGKVVGGVEVFYLEKMPEVDEGPFLNEERDLIRRYSERLGKIIERKQAEMKLEQLTYNLQERCKELECVYSVSKTTNDQGKPLAEILHDIVKILPPSWQYPEITYAKITVEGLVYATQNYLDTAWKQTRDIVVWEKRTGTLEVGYLREMPLCDTGPFLREEEKLLNDVAAQLGNMLERKWAEDALKKSEERHRLAIDGTGDGIWEWDVASGEILYDPYWSQLLGYNPGEIDFNFNWWESNINSESIPIYKNALKEYLEGKSKYYEFEYQIKSKSGEWKWVWKRASCIEYDQEGNPLKFIGTHRDITERKRIEQDSRLLEEKYSKAFNSTLDALTISTLDTGEFLEVNRGFEQLSGYSREEVMGKSPHDLNLWWKASDWKSVVGILRRENQVENVELSFRTSSGVRVHGLVAATIIHLKEGPCILSSFRDITESKRTEKVLKQQTKDMEEINIALTVLLKKRDQEKQAYEKNSLNTLRTLVFPFLDKLLGSALSPTQKSYLTTVTSNLNSIYSPFSSRLARYDRSLTPSEIHVAECIRQGKSTKEVALLLNLSEKTIATHRRNIRVKLGILNRKVNLRTFLQSLEEPSN